jgi:hypothetical protein
MKAILTVQLLAPLQITHRVTLWKIPTMGASYYSQYHQGDFIWQQLGLDFYCFLTYSLIAYPMFLN